ncbi:internal scaffolding protein [Flyfo microvirus Tbat2_130]|nr:internal scaffolding protein [Flyfo microvirus Tbat2_130]
MDKIDKDTGEIQVIEHDWNPPFLRTPYNYDRMLASDLDGLECPEPTLAQQQFKEDSDINTLVKRFGITGEMPQLDRIPMNDDFVPIMDYHSAANALLSAKQEFMKLPADVRTRFDNDPGKFLDFTSNEANREELGKMGLLKQPVGPVPGGQPTGDTAPPPPDPNVTA